MRRIVIGLAIAMWSAAALAETVATVGSRQITRAELEKDLRSELYEVLKDGLDQIVVQEMIDQEAKARKLSSDALLQEEITAKVKAPSDEEVKQFYDANAQAMQGQTFDAIKGRIVGHLQQQRLGGRQAEFIEELKKKYKVSINLPAPVFEVATDGHPQKGPSNAPITLVEFSDYECPACRSAEAMVAKVLQTHGDKVRLVFRNFPLPMHKNAQPAAEAAACANAQGKFWDYHSKLFANTDLSAAKFKAIAGEAGLDVAKFDDCMAKGQFKAAVEKDMEEGKKLGINATPTFFVNGHHLQHDEDLNQVIGEELAKKAGGGKS